ncbi:hypothetical protein G6F40_017538 [Rhizopus arrhizus]|uniref:Uncharacterized protein n=1 Tax=Rhizopus oryzae TaxID=64495 RepID=A0A9P6WSG5_RHIOR|nr:hypothetical protein G6F40_017538 [Rhizopus arrhizus]KAG1243702.1 hypothetical protein G6F68_015733 [Rhizopus microsporus]KAG1251429.1 hypothetical protein G6F65_018363 [Rhizopus arrhizus]KAG1273481.1 hypothetical protein G6F64_015343 [Rhizopus arrhizus]
MAGHGGRSAQPGMDERRPRQRRSGGAHCGTGQGAPAAWRGDRGPGIGRQSHRQPDRARRPGPVRLPLWSAGQSQ